jgi:hypothetical protein
MVVSQGAADIDRLSNEIRKIEERQVQRAVTEERKADWSLEMW